MEKKILIAASSHMEAMQMLEQINSNFMNNLETIRPDLFEVGENWFQSKFAIMGTSKVPELHDRVNLDIIDDLEDSKLITVYYQASQGMTEAKTIIDFDHFDNLNQTQIEELKRFISLSPKILNVSEELGKIGTSFSFIKPKKEAKITPNPASRQYKSKRK